MDTTRLAHDLGMYILDDDDRPVPAPDVLAWGRWKAEHGHRCRVDRTQLAGLEVSTVFLTQDHRMGRDSLPILYETALFRDGDLVGVYGRYATLEEAQAGHDEIVLQLLHDEPL